MIVFLVILGIALYLSIAAASYDGAQKFHAWNIDRIARAKLKEKETKPEEGPYR